MGGGRIDDAEELSMSRGLLRKKTALHEERATRIVNYARRERSRATRSTATDWYDLGEIAKVYSCRRH
jgi:hypothetical protein